MLQGEPALMHTSEGSPCVAQRVWPMQTDGEISTGMTMSCSICTLPVFLRTCAAVRAVRERNRELRADDAAGSWHLEDRALPSSRDVHIRNARRVVALWSQRKRDEAQRDLQRRPLERTAKVQAGAAGLRDTQVA